MAYSMQRDTIYFCCIVTGSAWIVSRSLRTAVRQYVSSRITYSNVFTVREPELNQRANWVTCRASLVSKDIQKGDL